jgi:hypothetical protein
LNETESACSRPVIGMMKDQNSGTKGRVTERPFGHPVGEVPGLEIWRYTKYTITA